MGSGSNFEQRIEKGQTEYQIKWKVISETTWEPPNCLTTAKELVNKYNMTHRALQRPRNGSLKNAYRKRVNYSVSY